jgi:plastocyanin
VAVAGAAALAAAPALGAAKPKPRTVQLHDNFYAPAKVTVRAGTQIRWYWADDTTDVHDVQLVSAPKGVKKFQTDPLAAGLAYRRRLATPGLYRFICSFHEDEMTMQIRVKRAPRGR